ncbi:MAG: cytochrome c3 family protein [Kiritimatiellia bacterium]
MASGTKSNPPRERTAPRRLLRAAAGYLCLVSIIGCATPRSRHEWLTLFFDGVPPEGGAPAAESGTPKPRKPKESPVTPKPAQVFVVHDPYKEKSCAECHISKFSQKLTGGMLEVCFKCHDNFLEKAVSKHDPVSGGECTQCHEPHRGKLAKLLKLPTPQGCYECHDDMTKSPVTHDPVKEGSCLECHDPHASKNKKLLKKPTPEGCYECHDKVAEAEFKHDPVAEGSCLECHDPHAAKVKGLLKKATSQGCYECHDDLSKAKFTHDPVKEGSRLEGEDSPHASKFKRTAQEGRERALLECHDEADTLKSDAHARTPEAACTPRATIRMRRNSSSRTRRPGRKPRDRPAPRPACSDPGRRRARAGANARQTVVEEPRLLTLRPARAAPLLDYESYQVETRNQDGRHTVDETWSLQPGGNWALAGSVYHSSRSPST